MQKRARTDVYTRARGEVFCSLLSRPDVYKKRVFFCQENAKKKKSGKTNFFSKGERERETLLFGEKIALIIIYNNKRRRTRPASREEETHRE